MPEWFKDFSQGKARTWKEKEAQQFQDAWAYAATRFLKKCRERSDKEAIYNIFNATPIRPEDDMKDI